MSSHWVIWGNFSICFHFLLFPLRFPPPPETQFKKWPMGKETWPEKKFQTHPTILRWSLFSSSVSVWPCHCHVRYMSWRPQMFWWFTKFSCPSDRLSAFTIITFYIPPPQKKKSLMLLFPCIPLLVILQFAVAVERRWRGQINKLCHLARQNTPTSQTKHKLITTM